MSAGGQTVHEVRALALAYDAAQDRVLAAVNPGALNARSFWLTRRLVLGVLGQALPALEASVPAVSRAPVEFRSDLAVFERESALARTEAAMSRTETGVLQASAAAAELALAFAIVRQGEGQGEMMRVEIRGVAGGMAAGVLGRAELQRILNMLQSEADRAGWMQVPSGATPDVLTHMSAALRRQVN